MNADGLTREPTTDFWDAIDWPRLAERIALAQHRAANDPNRTAHGFAATGQALRDILSSAGSGILTRGEAAHLTERAATAERINREASERTCSRLMSEAGTAVADALDDLARGLAEMADRTPTKYRAEGVRIAAGVVAQEARKLRRQAARAEPDGQPT